MSGRHSRQMELVNTGSRPLGDQTHLNSAMRQSPRREGLLTGNRLHSPHKTVTRPASSLQRGRLAICVEICTVLDMPKSSRYSLSISEASAKGVAALAHDAEIGGVVVLERRHQPIAAVIGLSRFERLQEAERDLRDIGVALTRAVTDDGLRYSLPDVFERFGFDRRELEAELDEDLAAGLE